MFHVLLVDDEEDLLFLAKEFLLGEDPRFEIEVATSAKEALKLLENNKFNVVVSDYQMPGMDGLQLLEHLRNKKNDIPFIMFTGRGREEVAIRALNLGADYYVKKGGDPQSQYAELAHIIRNIVTHKHAVKVLLQTEKQLWESELKYRELVEKMLEGVLVEDEDGIITFVNQRTTEMLNYAKQELIGQHWSTIVPTSAHNKIQEETAVRSNGISSTYESALLSKDGTPIPVIISATPLFNSTGHFQSVLAVFTDISERKRMEEALRDNEKTFRRIFEAIPDPAYLWERQPDGRIILEHANKPAIEFTRGKVDEEVGTELEEVYTNDPDIIKIVKHTMDTGISTQNEIQRRLRGTGKKKWQLLDFVKPAEERVLVIAKDITKLKLVEEQLQKQKEELSEFAHAMAHDLGNSLTTIQGYSELLLKENPGLFINKIHHNSIEMNNLLIRSLELADAGLVIEKSSNIDLNQVVSRIASITIPEGVKFSQKELPTVDCDQEKVAQIFRNLFKNAIIHGDPKKIEVDLYNTNKGVTLLISNDGKQITTENRSKLFQRGFSTKKDGLSLGLVIVKKLVEAHGWNISLQNGPKTTFRIFIPTEY